MDEKKIARANKLHPFVLKAAIAFMEDLEKLGIEAGIFSGYRSFDQQAALFAKGRTAPGKIVTNSAPGNSYHNYGLAIDVVFLKNGSWTWVGDFGAISLIGKARGFSWGGNWEWKDFCHFQMDFGLSIKTLKTFYEAGGIRETWAFIDNLIKKKIEKRIIN